MFQPIKLNHGQKAPWDEITHVRLRPDGHPDSPAAQSIITHIRKFANADGIAAICDFEPGFPHDRVGSGKVQSMRHSLRHFANKRDAGERKENKGLLELGTVLEKPSRMSPKSGAETPTKEAPHLPAVQAAREFRAGGESDMHRALKEYVAANPSSVGLESFATGECEYPLPSGDRVDVMFSNLTQMVAVEVKHVASPVPDIARGIFQCVKYKAVLEAYLRSQGSALRASSILALQGMLPPELHTLRDMLGISVCELVRANG